MTNGVQIEARDLAAAERWRDILCHRDSEYLGDAVADLAADFARHRDAILALTPVEGVGEDEARLLKGSASAEQMYADMYPEHAATIARIIDAYNFDTPSDRARAHEVARAMGGHPRATPVAQGDEVRDALERIDKFVTDYLSPWGSWKTPWWEGEVSDEAAFSDDNALKHCANIARSALATLTKGARDAG